MELSDKIYWNFLFLPLSAIFAVSRKHSSALLFTSSCTVKSHSVICEDYKVALSTPPTVSLLLICPSLCLEIPATSAISILINSRRLMYYCIILPSEAAITPVVLLFIAPASLPVAGPSEPALKLSSTTAPIILA